MAVKTGVPVVPITLVGTGRLMPNGQVSSSERCFLVIHVYEVHAVQSFHGVGFQPINIQEGKLYAGSGVRIIVHPRITGGDAGKMCDEVRKVIASRLPPGEVA